MFIRKLRKVKEGTNADRVFGACGHLFPHVVVATEPARGTQRQVCNRPSSQISQRCISKNFSEQEGRTSLYRSHGTPRDLQEELRHPNSRTSNSRQSFSKLFPVARCEEFVSDVVQTRHLLVSDTRNVLQSAVRSFISSNQTEEVVEKSFQLRTAFRIPEVVDQVTFVFVQNPQVTSECETTFRVCQSTRWL